MFEALLDSAASEGDTSSLNPAHLILTLALGLALALALTLTLIRIHQLAKQGGLHQERQVLARRALANPNPNPKPHPHPNPNPHPYVAGPAARARYRSAPV